jgi:tetratricopeptide (TPR) repeat protein
MKDERIKSFNNSGICFIRLKDYIAAKEQFQESLKLDLMNIKANYFIGKCYFELKNNLDAKEKL